MLGSRTPEGPLYRIVRGDKPWEFKDWKLAGKEQSGAVTFGNRFDDPDGGYRVLYASSQLTSCYVETLSRNRCLHSKRRGRGPRGVPDFVPNVHLLGFVSQWSKFGPPAANN